ncbi:hypothetical protein EC912_102513 [Luteibacter rhizovicinus]|uniref:Uncharacterized protein n=1 Tax=Luteibacter rhizovicinus TaxID=242606 RepID=A0A4R3YXW0_9GAMM|nr:hypothetical protein [Luteibacter rhizovicinus]TCV96163.1 hypothetical protein EC912_102513 [Luteibacter rhizovicinus]
MNRLAVFAVLTLACVACSKKIEPQPPTPQAAASTARVATPWDPLLADKKRAEDVQKTVDDQAKRQRDAVDAQDK